MSKYHEWMNLTTTRECRLFSKVPLPDVQNVYGDYSNYFAAKHSQILQKKYLLCDDC